MIIVILILNIIIHNHIHKQQHDTKVPGAAGLHGRLLQRLDHRLGRVPAEVLRPPRPRRSIIYILYNKVIHNII